MSTTRPLQDLDPASLYHINRFLPDRDQNHFASSCKRIRQVLVSKDEIERRTYKKAHRMATAFAKDAKRSAEALPPREKIEETGPSAGRWLFSGADVLVKKSLDPERSPRSRAIYLGLAVGAVPAGLALCAGLLGVTGLAVRGAKEEHAKRHDQRRSIRASLKKFEAQLQDLPTCVSPSKLLEALAPATAFLEDVGSHDKLRMRRPEARLEKVAARIALAGR